MDMLFRGAGGDGEKREKLGSMQVDELTRWPLGFDQGWVS